VALPAEPATGEPARTEFLLAGTSVPRPGRTPVGPAGPSRTGTAAGSTPLGIVHPVAGSVYAIDPNIPPHAQRLRFEGREGTWLLNGSRLGTGSRWDWTPVPGRHTLRLVGANGATIQEMVFEVRSLNEPIIRENTVP